MLSKRNAGQFTLTRYEIQKVSLAVVLVIHMVRPFGRQFHLTLPTIGAIFHVAVALLLLPIAPIFRLNRNTPHAPLVLHTVTMSQTSTPNATSWIQSRLTALYEDVSAQDAFDRAFSPACEVRLNHDVHSLQSLKDDLASRRVAATHVSVAWDADVVSTNDDNPEEVR